MDDDEGYDEEEEETEKPAATDVKEDQSIFSARPRKDAQVLIKTSPYKKIKIKKRMV